jgi:hypothetical protein
MSTTLLDVRGRKYGKLWESFPHIQADGFDLASFVVIVFVVVVNAVFIVVFITVVVGFVTALVNFSNEETLENKY